MQEKELRKVLGVNLEPSRIIDARMEETYQMIRNAEVRPERSRNLAAHRIVVGMGSVAAVLVLMATFCVMNPVLASEIPIVGGIFNKLSELFSFGQIPEEETVVLFQEKVNNTASGTPKSGDAKEQSAYQKTSGDLTITLTEVYATNQAFFIGVSIKNIQEFPEMVVFADGTQKLSVETAEQYSFRADSVPALRSVEGKFMDAHTFDGILRIDYSEINVDDRKYQEAIKDMDIKNMPVITDANYDQYMEKYEIPETFTMKLEISNVVGDLAEPLPLPPIEGRKSQEEIARMTDEEWQAYMRSLPPQEWDQFPNKYENWWQEGSWSYDLTITKKDSASRVIEVNRTNDAGIGIKSIELSSVEMTLNIIEDDNTIAVALDADGNKFEYGSSNVYELAIAGHDISKIYIYICDYDEYMDEIKGYGIPSEQRDRSFKEVLEERALFKTVVETGK